MTIEHPEDLDDGFFDYDESPVCEHCGGEGFLLVCIDDLCQGQGHCIHGDGEITCPHCGGQG